MHLMNIIILKVTGQSSGEIFVIKKLFMSAHATVHAYYINIELRRATEISSL